MMTNRAVLTALLATLLAALVLAAGPENETVTTGPPDDEMPMPDEETLDIMATLNEDGGLTTVAALLRECNLDSLLNQDGPFTLFAPDDSAFAEMPDEQRSALTADKQALRELLVHHIVTGTALEFAEIGEETVKAMDGRDLVIVADHEEVTVDDASVIDEGIWCRNGVIHVIDRVLKPVKTTSKG